MVKKTLELIKKKYRGYGLGIVNGNNELVSKHNFECEFKGGVKLTMSVDEKKEIEELKAITLEFVWKNKKNERMGEQKLNEARLRIIHWILENKRDSLKYTNKTVLIDKINSELMPLIQNTKVENE